MPTAKLDESLEMYYEDDDYTDPWRDPETVVLHHGNAKSSRLWYAWVPLLARQYRVVRLDARGFGRSSLPPEGYEWSLSNFSTDLLRLLDKLGLEKIHLVGFAPWLGRVATLHWRDTNHNWRNGAGNAAKPFAVQRSGAFLLRVFVDVSNDLLPVGLL